MNRPEIGADPIGIRGDEPVGDDHPLDHVGEHGRQRTVTYADGDHRSVCPAPDGAVGADQTRGATEAGRDETLPADVAGDLSRQLGEVDHRSVLHGLHLDEGLSHAGCPGGLRAGSAPAEVDDELRVGQRCDRRCL